MTQGFWGRLGGVQFYSAPHLKWWAGQFASTALSKKQQSNSNIWITHANLPSTNEADESPCPFVPLFLQEVQGQKHFPLTCLVEVVLRTAGNACCPSA